MHSGCTSKLDLSKRDIVSDFVRSRRQSIALQDPFVRFWFSLWLFCPHQSRRGIPSNVMRALLPRGVIEREGPTSFFAVAYRSAAQATPSRNIFLERSYMKCGPSCLLLFKDDTALFLLLLKQLYKVICEKERRIRLHQVNFSPSAP